MPATTRPAWGDDLPAAEDAQAQREYEAAMANIQGDTAPAAQVEPVDQQAELAAIMRKIQQHVDAGALGTSEPGTIVEYTARDYKAERLIALPSGKGIRIHSVSLSSLMRKGNVPNTLITAARRTLGFDKTPISKSESDKATQEGLDLIDYMCCKLIASFKVVDKSPEACADDEVSVECIADADKTFLMNWLVRGQQALEPFRSVQ